MFMLPVPCVGGQALVNAELIMAGDPDPDEGSTQRSTPPVAPRVRRGSSRSWPTFLIPPDSLLVCAETVPATDVAIEQLHRIADVVGFPKSQLFLFDEQQVAR